VKSSLVAWWSKIFTLSLFTMILYSLLLKVSTSLLTQDEAIKSCLSGIVTIITFVLLF